MELILTIMLKSVLNLMLNLMIPTIEMKPKVRGDSMILKISWAAEPAGPGPCSFDRGWSLVVI